ncbi:MoaF C-terminal domain-containing protein [uncultured Amnibacterium sp.]|uniref:MoaF C-terminal domain-containing protein n=1 Tax=uncultured Amnibacterium sp. TaxID=1631851 RepID=UPI0035C9A6A0
MTAALSDTSMWLPLEGLEPGFDENKPTPSSDLDGRGLAVVSTTGSRVEVHFEEGAVGWRRTLGGDDSVETSGHDAVEVFRIDEDLYLAQLHFATAPDEAMSLVLDLRSGQALIGLSVLGDAASGRTAVQQRFEPAVIEGLQPRGAAPSPTTALIGRRVEWVYSTEHAYEHVYLSPHWYTWQCLAGPERGLADTDEVSVWELRPGIYVFAWREKVVPCGSVTVADHRNPNAITSVGVLFGRNSDGGHGHFTFGAKGRLISVSAHGPGLDPAGF